MGKSKGTLSASQSQSFAPQTLYPFEFFSLLGLDTFTPDELADPRRCVYGRNFRLYNPDSTSSRVALSKRRGHTFYSVPIGETLDQSITSVTGAADKSIGTISWIAQKFVAGSSGNLTKVDLNIKSLTGGTGPVIVAIYSDSSGPSALLATSSIPSTSLATSYGYLTARYIEAPPVVSGTTYWIVSYIQSNGSNFYAWSSTTSATTAMTSANSGNTWSTTAFAMNYKTYVSTAGEVKGVERYYKTGSVPVTLFAHNTNLYTVNDGTGATTSIKSGLSAGSVNFDFAAVNNKEYFVNGQDVPMVYDGSTVANVAGSPVVSSQVEVHSNSLFLLQPNTNFVTFSDPGAYETFSSASFLYIPAPNTADAVIKMVSVQGTMYFITRNTKYLLYGTTSINSGTTASTANLVLKESPATKGAVSVSAICVSEDSTYFLSDDYHVYAFNGGSDTKLSSERVASILRNLGSYSSVKLYVDDKKLYVAYTPNGQISNQNRLVYDLVFGEWLNDEQTYTGYGISLNSQSDTGQSVVSSSVVGALYYSDIGYNDVGKPIAFDWWSKYMSFGSPAAKHRVKRYYPFLRNESGNYSVDCQIDQDNLNTPTSNLVSVNAATHLYGDAGLVYGSVASGGSGLTYGNSTLPLTRIAVPGAYRKTQFRFVQSGVDEPVGVIGFSLYVLPKRPV